MKNRLFLRRLESVSPNKTAGIDFKYGLNIITGASDTGKSYIIECIDYLFGAEKQPKDIAESLNYKYLLLEIKIGDQIYTLKRFLRDAKLDEIHLFECPISNIDTVEPKILGINDRYNDSISNYIMQLTSFANKKILSKTQTSYTKNISLRALLNFNIVNETNIISENSPVYIDNYDHVGKKSLFKYLLTGKDDSNLKKRENPKITKAKLIAQIEVYNELIKKASLKLEELEDFNAEDLNEQIESLEKQYEYNTTILNRKTKQRTELIKHAESLKNMNIESSRLINRYNLLKEYYNNDIKRLDFLEEGSFLLEQLNNAPCPICNNLLNVKDINNYKAINEACIIELQKTKIKMNDLTNAYEEEKNNIKNNKEKISKLISDIGTLTNEIDDELKPYTSVIKKRLDDILKLQNKVELKNKLRNDISTYRNSLQECQNKLDNCKDLKFDNSINGKYLEDFSKHIKNFLDSWKYNDDCHLFFDTKDYDIVIDGKPRAHLGKGHRALTRAAFTLGLQGYMYDTEHPFPAFVILDSPLLSLKEANYSKEKLPDTIQNAFWENLSNVSNDRQIIIIENKEPSKKVQEKSNYILFTHNYNKGRYGFY